MNKKIVISIISGLVVVGLIILIYFWKRKASISLEKYDNVSKIITVKVKSSFYSKLITRSLSSTNAQSINLGGNFTITSKSGSFAGLSIIAFSIEEKGKVILEAYINTLTGNFVTGSN